MTPKHWDHNLFFISCKASGNCQSRLLIRTCYLWGFSGRDVRHSWEGGIWTYAADLQVSPKTASNSGALIAREEPSDRGELQRKTVPPTVHSPHHMQNVFKMQINSKVSDSSVFPLHLGQNPNSLSWATILYVVHPLPGTLSSSLLPWLAILLVLALWNLFSLFLALCPLISSPSCCFPGQALAQCSQLSPESLAQNVLLWKQFPELQSLFQLIPMLASFF